LYLYDSFMTNPVLSTPFILDYIGPVPIYQQIKQWIQAQITSGTWPEHYKLKAETDLAAELEVSRGTVRRAIAELADEGILVRTHGRGTFVVSGGLEQPLAEHFVTFSEDLMSKGIPFETQVLKQTVIQASGRVAAQLAINPGTKVFFLKRLRWVEQEPIVLVNNYLVYAYCPHIEEIDFTQYRLFETLEGHFGLKLDCGRRTFQAQAADEETAQWLNLPPSEPVMYIEQQTYLDDGALVEFSEVWSRGNQLKVSALVKRHGPAETKVSLAVLYPNQAAKNQIKL
jgi:GntR family transcriptional regulator